MTQRTKELVFLGTGAGNGVPSFYCRCKVCKEALNEPRYRRTRCAAVVPAKNNNYLFDAPPELASQLLRENIRSVDCLFLTHAHHDHSAGLGDLEIYTRFHREDPLPATMSRETLTQLDRSYDSIREWLDVNLIEPEETMELPGITISALEVSHAPGTLGYMIHNHGSRTAYIPDTGPLPNVTKARLTGIETLILDSTFWGDNWYPDQHFSVDEAIETALELDVRNLYLTHLSMHYSKPVTNAEIEQKISQFKGRVNLAYDGLRLSLNGKESEDDIAGQEKEESVLVPLSARTYGAARRWLGRTR